MHDEKAKLVDFEFGNEADDINLTAVTKMDFLMPLINAMMKLILSMLENNPKNTITTIL